MVTTIGAYKLPIAIRKGEMRGRIPVGKGRKKKRVQRHACYGNKPVYLLIGSANEMSGVVTIVFFSLRACDKVEPDA